MIPALYGCFYLAFYILSVLGCISVLGFVLRLSQNLDCISVFGLGFSVFEFCGFLVLSARPYILDGHLHLNQNIGSNLPQLSMSRTGP